MSESRQQPELKPCPFCGTEAVISHDGAGGLALHCDNSDTCAVYPEIQAEIEDEGWVIKTWNTRFYAPVVDGISWSALIAVLERLRSKNRNPENEWYHGWNAAIQCLINDIINARGNA